VTPPDATRYSVAGADALALLARAREKPYVRDATIFGDVVHVVVDDRVATDRIAADLGLSTADIEPIGPSLEDVFVALTRERNRA
jgi:hypothetical protein